MIETNETPTHGGAKRRSRGKRLKSFGRILWMPLTTRLIGLIAAGAVVFAGGSVLFQRQSREADVRVADGAAFNAYNLYILKVQAYNAAVSARDLCIDSVGRSLDNRAGWEQLASIVGAFPGEGAAKFATEIRTGPVLGKPARTTDECGTAPIAPDPVPLPG